MPILLSVPIPILLFLILCATAIIALANILVRKNSAISQLSSEKAALANRINLLASQLAIMVKKNQPDRLSGEMEQLAHQIDLGIIILGKNQTITSVNPYAQRLLGVSKLGVLAMKFTDVIHLTDGNRAAVTKPLESAAAGTPAPLPFWTFIEHGTEYIPVIGTFKPLRIEGAEELIAFTFCDAREPFARSWQLDQLAQQSSQTSLALSRELSELKFSRDVSSKILDYLDLSLIIFDAAGIAVQANTYAETFLGTLKSEFIGKQYREFLILKNSADQIAYLPLESAFSGTDAQLPKWTFITTKNGQKAVRGGVKILTGPAGATFVALYFYDATSSHREETEERAFFSSVAHDLRSPLTTIRGVTELLETSFASMPPDQVKELLAGAKDSTVHLISLVNDLLNVSRIEQNRIVIRKAAMDLAMIVKNAVTDMQVNAKEKKIGLVLTQPDEAIPKVLGDEMKTAEVITNVISNSIKYTHEGTVTVKLIHEGSHVGVYIEDTGIGIAQQNQPLLFKKFQQVGSARNLPGTKSTGLGLYISKKFADLMGGSLELVRSEPDKGSVFKFSLPVAPA
jgi:signal transduction histidine kinase